jgi:hypothetical protein
MFYRVAFSHTTKLKHRIRHVLLSGQELIIQGDILLKEVLRDFLQFLYNNGGTNP